MDSDDIEKLGSRMRDVYADVAAPVPAGEAPSHPSTRLRKNRYVTGVAAAKAGISQDRALQGDAPQVAAGSATASARGFAQQRPFVTLLVAAGAGYVLARLTR